MRWNSPTLWCESPRVLRPQIAQNIVRTFFCVGFQCVFCVPILCLLCKADLRCLANFGTHFRVPHVPENEKHKPAKLLAQSIESKPVSRPHSWQRQRCPTLQFSLMLTVQRGFVVRAPNITKSVEPDPVFWRVGVWARRRRACTSDGRRATSSSCETALPGATFEHPTSPATLPRSSGTARSLPHVSNTRGNVRSLHFCLSASPRSA